MKKTVMAKRTVLFTHPVFIIGSYDAADRPNIMAVSWGGICCSEPPCVAISLRKATYTYHNIMAHKAFTLNIPSEQNAAEADYVGVYSGRDEDKFKSTGLTPVDAQVVHAPYIKEFPMALLCSVKHVIEIGLHTQFIGEIIESIADENVLNAKGQPDINLIKPFIYNSVDRGYYGIGEKVQNAFVNVK